MFRWSAAAGRALDDAVPRGDDAHAGQHWYAYAPTLPLLPARFTLGVCSWRISQGGLCGYIDTPPCKVHTVGMYGVSYREVSVQVVRRPVPPFLQVPSPASPAPSM